MYVKEKLRLETEYPQRPAHAGTAPPEKPQEVLMTNLVPRQSLPPRKSQKEQAGHRVSQWHAGNHRTHIRSLDGKENPAQNADLVQARHNLKTPLIPSPRHETAKALAGT